LIVYVPLTVRFGCQPSGSPAEERVGKPPEGGVEVGVEAEIVGASVGELEEVDGALEEVAGALGLTLAEGLGLRVGAAMERDARWCRPGGRWPVTAEAATSGRTLTSSGCAVAVPNAQRVPPVMTVTRTLAKAVRHHRVVLRLPWGGRSIRRRCVLGGMLGEGMNAPVRMGYRQRHRPYV
jgi:hypothetical protein